MIIEYQPLDGRIFGSFKARIRAQFDRDAMRADEELTMPASIGIWLGAWRCFGNEAILEIWAPLT
jgi:hypothetical protein